MYSNQQAYRLQSYYKWHAPLYDATRWSFLFGRRRLIEILPDLPPQPRILDVGCGTGRNLPLLALHYPEAEITGIDLSSTMLQKASRKIRSHEQVNLIHGCYGAEPMPEKPFDLIFLSYSVTMMGDQISPVLQQITQDLCDNGHIAVVDFHQTSLCWFQQWMRKNHVLMDGSLLPLLRKIYRPVQFTTYPAYLGLWSYFLFLGNKG